MNNYIPFIQKDSIQHLASDNEKLLLIYQELMATQQSNFNSLLTLIGIIAGLLIIFNYFIAKEIYKLEFKQLIKEERKKLKSVNKKKMDQVKERIFEHGRWIFSVHFRSVGNLAISHVLLLDSFSSLVNIKEYDKAEERVRSIEDDLKEVNDESIPIDEELYKRVIKRLNETKIPRFKKHIEIIKNLVVEKYKVIPKKEHPNDN
jgi:hypothetical protein